MQRKSAYRQDPEFPARPPFAPLTLAKRKLLFGAFRYVPDPSRENPERIRILGAWESRNIVTVQVPQLVGVIGAPENLAVRFHRLAAQQFLALWDAWAKSGLLKDVLTWNGSFVPRFVRGSKSVLSNHSFGSAFDINAVTNPLGRPPAKRSSRGCVYDLVAIAHAHGFFWGGHFSRPDGMHFEVAALI